jgi:chloramphenicol 3-O phosphotransferase
MKVICQTSLRSLLGKVQFHINASWPMNRSAQIILLNGVGSSGKSSIAAKCSRRLPTNLSLHVQDDFCAMLPEALQDHPDGFAFEEISENGAAGCHQDRAVGARAMRGMRHAIAAMAAQWQQPDC